MAFDIQKKRKDLNLTLDEIAKFVGVSKSTVKKWESGYIKNMKRDKIIKLANILDVSPIDILQASDNKTANATKLSVPLTDELFKNITKSLQSTMGLTPEDNFILIVKDKELTFIDFQDIPVSIF